MTPISPEQLSRAQPILQKICADNGALCLLQPDGTKVWQSPECELSELSLIEEIDIIDEQTERLARVAIFWRGEIAATELDALRQLVAGWSQECALVRELDEMASELAERYEELNLLYKPSKKNSDRDNEADQIQSLLDECVSKLNLDHAIAMQSDFGLFYATHESGTTPLYSEREYTSLLREASSTHADTPIAVIINDTPEQKAIGPIPGYHAVYSPLQPSPANSLGGLWFSGPKTKRNFSTATRVSPPTSPVKSPGTY